MTDNGKDDDLLQQALDDVFGGVRAKPAADSIEVVPPGPLDELAPVAPTPLEFVPASYRYGNRRMVPVQHVVGCADCNVIMALEAANVETTPPAYFYRCPQCKKGHIDTQVFPRIEYVPDEGPRIIQSQNFVNPNKGPRGRH